MKKPRSVLLGVAAIFAAIVAAVVPELRHQPSTLLDRAQKVASVGQWDPKCDNYFWLSGQQVLVVMQPGGPSYIGTSVSARRINLATGAASEDTPLEAVFSQVADGALVPVPAWQLSPDASYLLCHDNSRFWLVSLDKPTLITRPFQGYSPEEHGTFTAWLPDSTSWVQAAEGGSGGVTHNYLYRVATSAVVDHVGNFGLDGLEVVGFSGPTRLLTLLPKTGDGGGISMADYDVLNPATTAHFHMEHVPPNMDVQEVALSPDRTRLAWKFAVKPLPLGLKATINSSYVRRSSPTSAGLWVSDLNCDNLQEVGALDIRDDHISNLRWTPDGTRLSFIDGDALYTVPVN